MESTQDITNAEPTAAAEAVEQPQIKPKFYFGTTQWDRDQSVIIKQILIDDYKNYESENDHTRYMVTIELNKIIKDWIKECGKKDKKKLSKEEIENSGGKLFEFGSYRLGVHSPGTDIDALCLAPRHIDRDEDFFGELPNILRKTPGVEKLIEVREAFVPCIKMIYKNVDIDLLFARVEYKFIPDDFEDLQDNSILRNCDSNTIRSLNGRRATDAILEHVKGNLPTFQLTLRCIKLWAKNRGIYSNVFGYCGGVAYAILVAYICKENPNLETCQLLDTFFRYYRYREWNYNNPIHLCPILNDPELVKFKIEDESLFYKQDQHADFFPIITPAFPSMNSTYNVSLTTRNIMITEMEKAMEITKHMMKQKTNNKTSWKRLFKKFPFFKAYSHFIQISILSET